MKSGNLNFLEPSGPLQACNGTVLPFLIRAVEIRSLVDEFEQQLTFEPTLFHNGIYSYVYVTNLCHRYVFSGIVCSCRGGPIVLEDETSQDIFCLICQISDVATKTSLPFLVEEIRVRNI
jgi:hypothetical protein